MSIHTKYSNVVKPVALLLMIVLILTLSACSSASSNSETQTQTEPQQTQEATADTKAADTQNSTEAEKSASNGAKTLVVYFSATGTTKGVAQMIATVTKADLYEITAAETYTADDLNWNDSNSRTTLEQNDKSVRPAINSEKL